MSDAALAVQAAAVAALTTVPGLAGVYDGPPPRAPYPYASISNGLVTDWSTKTETGREIRLAVTIWDDGDEPARLHSLMASTEDALGSLPRDLPGWRIASCVFLRALIARDAAGPWAGLVEYRVRVLAG